MKQLLWVVRKVVLWLLLVNVVVGFGRKMMCGVMCMLLKIMMLVGVVELVFGCRVINWWVLLLNSVVWGWLFSGCIVLVGFCEVGGDIVGWVGLMVGGYLGVKLVSGFEEQFVIRIDNINRLMKWC